MKSEKWLKIRICLKKMYSQNIYFPKCRQKKGSDSLTIDLEINPHFHDFIFDWDYRTYLLVGSYGSSKSWHIALKIILKCSEEKRKVLVVREVYDTHRESTYSLLKEILEKLNFLEESNIRKSNKAIAKESPLEIKFPNGSQIIFKGMDKPEKLKSINNISIVWLEEASEIKYKGYKELLGRLRHPSLSIHFILSTNPVDSWVYDHFFKSTDDKGHETIILDDIKLYKRRIIIKNGVYYHHSTVDDNFFVQQDYIDILDDMETYDEDLYRVARQGRFGVDGIRVLPQLRIAKHHDYVISKVSSIPEEFKFSGFDFGFEESYNALVKMAVDDKNKILYLYKEYYKNHMTDDKTAEELVGWDENIQNEVVTADCEDPKAIKFYNQQGFTMRKCHKFAGSRLSNTRKVKRFRRIIVSPECPNCIKELKHLSYKKDAKGKIIYDQFNIDAHTFSAIWYGLDTYTVADIKNKKTNSWKG